MTDREWNPDEYGKSGKEFPEEDEIRESEEETFFDPDDEDERPDEEEYDPESEEYDDPERTPLVDDLYRFDFHRLRPLYGIEQVRRFYEIRRSRFSAIRIGLHLAGVTIFGAYLYYGLGYFLLGKLPEYGIVYFTFLVIAYLIACVPLYRYGSEPCRKAKEFLLYLMPPEGTEELLRKERTGNRIRIAAMSLIGCVIITLFAYKPVDTWIRRYGKAEKLPQIQAVCLIGETDDSVYF